MSEGMQINFPTDLEPLSFESVQMPFLYRVLLCWSEKTLILSNAQTLPKLSLLHEFKAEKFPMYTGTIYCPNSYYFILLLSYIKQIFTTCSLSYFSNMSFPHTSNPGFVQMLIKCLGRGSMADKPHTSQCPSMSVADITDWATSPAKVKILDFVCAAHI